MAKQTYYFSHDYAPTEDPKMVPLLDKFGGMGYGTYWHIVELLHREKGSKLPLLRYVYEAIASKMKWTPEAVEIFITYCISHVNLFNSDHGMFWSNRVFKNIDDRDAAHNKKVKAGRAGGIKSGKSRKSRKSTSLKQNEALLEANEALLEANEANEAKEKKRKENTVVDVDDSACAHEEKEGLKKNEISNPMAEFKKVTLSIKTIPVFEITYLVNGNQWQASEIEKFLLQNEIAFEGLLMQNKNLLQPGMYQKALQHFVTHFQTGGEEKSSSEITKHFRNWLYKNRSKLNEVLSELPESKKHSSSTAPTLRKLQ